MNPGAPFFTVVTPTYNRAHTLGRVYRSLQAQTLRDFEWVIVDDGSTDRTPELVEQWVGEARVSIRYFRQSNSGKHAAFNRAVTEARGEMVVPLDSDDECLPQALERFRYHWLAIPAGCRDSYSSILCLCRDERGELLGGPLPRDTIDGPSYEVTSRLGRTAEMWVALRTEVLRLFPFPEYAGEPFVPEALVWNRIGRHYVARFINEGLRIYFDSADSLSRSSVRLRAASPQATLAYYSETMDLPIRFTLRLRAAANLWRFALDARRFRAALGASAAHRGLSAIGFLPGLALHLRDRLTLRHQYASAGQRCHVG